ncbi:MAG: elongation factor G [Planctomycetota bacterium]
MTNLTSLRNIAFVGHPSAGKTTLVDALAFQIGATSRKGSVADRTSLFDTDPEEHERQHTLSLSVVSRAFGDRVWTLIDTPGYPEFVAEVQAATFAVELVVGVVSSAAVATYNFRQKIQLAQQMGRGCAIVVTHLDAESADFDQIVHALRAALGEECVPALLPNASGSGFTSVHRTLLDPASPWCQGLKDRVMDACEDEALLIRYLETQELTEEQLDEHAPNAIARGTLVPILVCNPVTGVGVENVLEYLRRFAPCPIALPPRDANGAELDPEGDLAGTVFAVRADPHLGKICLAKIHRGRIGVHDPLVGVAGDVTAKPEKIGGLFRLVGKNREPIDAATAGDLVGFSKVEHLGTWAAFTHAGAEPVVVPTPRVPAATMSLAIVAKSRNDEQKLSEALHKLEAEDPTFHMRNDPETHELVVSGMSDLHLDVVLARLARRYGVHVDTHLPKISYRQTITKPAEGHHRHKKQSGGRGQFGECSVRVRPAEPGSGLQFVDSVVGGAIPRNLIPAAEKGIRELAHKGVLCPGEVVDVVVELHDGKFHDVDSDEASFKIAGARALRDAFEKAQPTLLEPVMLVEVHVPTGTAGTVFSDLTSHRRGHVVSQESEGDGEVTRIEAEVPLATLLTYHRELKSQTAGQGHYSLRFARYAPLPLPEQKKFWPRSAPSTPTTDRRRLPRSGGASAYGRLGLRLGRPSGRRRTRYPTTSP